MTAYDGSVPVAQYAQGFMEIMGRSRNGESLEAIWEKKKQGAWIQRLQRKFLLHLALLLKLVYQIS